MSVQPPPLAGYQRLCLVPGGNSGANGQVFRERCLATGEDVAVKYQQLSALQNEDKRKSLVRELRNHAALVAHPHRNIVGLRTAALLPGDWIAIVAELCEGDNLLKWLNGQSGIRATEVLALGVIAQVLSAAHHMHALGIFHRDIKLDNVCLARPAPPGTVPEIRVIDFGHSKMMSIDSIPNSIVATGFYMPPEARFLLSSFDTSSVDARAGTARTDLPRQNCAGKRGAAGAVRRPEGGRVAHWRDSPNHAVRPISFRGHGGRRSAGHGRSERRRAVHFAPEQRAPSQWPFAGVLGLHTEVPGAKRRESAHHGGAAHGPVDRGRDCCTGACCSLQRVETSRDSDNRSDGLQRDVCVFMHSRWPRRVRLRLRVRR